SYRRGTTSGQARALQMALVQRFGADLVFMDVDSIAPGADFVENIERAIDSCAALLALIGSDWLERGEGSSTIDDPNDFVRLELATALEKGIPIIPILVERTPMPATSTLPDDLRSLTRRQALELENNRWEFDVSRLIKALEGMMAPTSSAGSVSSSSNLATATHEPPAVATPPDQEPVPPPEPSRRRKPLVLGAAVAVVVVIAVVLVILLSGGSSVGAEKNVARVPGEQLGEKLLRTSFTADEIPKGLTQPTIRIAALRSAGMVASESVSFQVPDGYEFIYYDTFADAASARTVYDIPLLSTGYRQTGTFSPSGVADQARCIDEVGTNTVTGTQQNVDICEALSDKARIFSEIGRDASAGNLSNAEMNPLLQAAIRHLARVADLTPTTAPALAAATPQALLAPWDQTEYPFELSPPDVSQVSASVDTAAHRGLTARVGVVFGRSDKKDSADSVYYSVFDTNDDARAFFDLQLNPVRSTKNNSVDSSGFSTPIYCGEFTYPGVAPSFTKVGQSACYLLVGNVVAESYTSSPTNTQAGDSIMTVTLARAALFHLDKLLERPGA
ncbi:MAG TPA: toll/interleukin-1 receptor domain-containing protein, partial [Actinomycetota bacterium]|nr:toll/interleukin-1 receptor domain-containing protein [Actinomycetota bacterium]